MFRWNYPLYWQYLFHSPNWFAHAHSQGGDSPWWSWKPHSSQTTFTSLFLHVAYMHITAWPCSSQHHQTLMHTVKTYCNHLKACVERPGFFNSQLSFKRVLEAEEETASARRGHAYAKISNKVAVFSSKIFKWTYYLFVIKEIERSNNYKQSRATNHNEWKLLCFHWGQII